MVFTREPGFILKKNHIYALLQAILKGFLENSVNCKIFDPLI